MTGPVAVAGRRSGYSVCTICDIGCQLRAEAEDGKLTRILPHDLPAMARNICFKGTAAPQIHNHSDRLRVPLKRVGERGDDRWEEISYDDAIDEIASRLLSVVDRYGPEAFAVSTSGWNTQTTHGFDRRFMNLLGSPNWISGVAMCAGNTAAVNRLTYGWMPWPDLPNTNCILLLGHNPRQHSWTPIYNGIEAARARGAQIIVVDPRVSEQAERADLHLPIRAGTDTVLLFGMLRVILDERLLDADFVRDWCVGFDALRARVDEFPLDRVASVCDLDPGLIVDAARMYASADGAVIPWTPITDQQLNSTSAIRLQSILRAITGNLDVRGGDVLHAPHPGWRTEAELQLHDAISPEQRAKQLGYDKHPVFTYRAAELFRPHLDRVWGQPWFDQVMGCQMANPTEVFRAMATGDPYPVKAFFTLGNNSLLSYPNQHQILRAILNQDLVVAHEIFMTPTAMLADYVLPGDVFSERNHVADAWTWSSRLTCSEQVADAPPEASSTFRFWTDLARRTGFADHFRWDTLEEVLDHRLEPSGRTWEEFRDTVISEQPAPRYRKYEQTGFATPSGKVELASSVLAELGFDPLPYYRPAPEPTESYRYRVFSGVREDPFFQTGQRNIDVLRRRVPNPVVFIHPDDAACESLDDGDWARVETPYGHVLALVGIRPGMKAGHLRVPHGWWYPEERGRLDLAGAFVSSDAVLTDDSDDLLDHEQGIPHFKGYPGRITKSPPPPTSVHSS